MDISGLSDYAGYLGANASTQAQNTELKNQIDSVKNSQDSEELLDACKQFEAYFLEQVFKEMQKTVNIGEKDSKTTDTMVDYFKDQGIQDLAAQSTENNSLGLAQMLYEQMKINYGISPDAIKEIE